MPTLNFISKKVPVITRLKLNSNKCTFFLHLCQKKCQNTVEGISQSGYILAVSNQIGHNRHSKASCSPRLLTSTYFATEGGFSSALSTNSGIKQEIHIKFCTIKLKQNFGTMILYSEKISYSKSKYDQIFIFH